MHLLKASVGTGVMVIPQAMGMAGLVTATVAMVLATAVLTHCLQVAVQSRYRACIRQRVPIMTYEEAMAEAVRAGPLCTRRFAATSSRVVTMFVNVFQLGCGCIYIVFMAETLRKLIDPSSSLLLYMAVLMPPLMALNLIPTLKRLAPVSALANLLLILGLCIVLFIIFTENGEVKNQDTLNVWGKPADFPMFFGIALFALCSVGVVLQLENSMLYPKSFTSTCGVFQQSMVMVLVMYLVFGLSGYALYCGDKCQDSITLDMPAGALPTTVNSLLVLAIFLSYVLHMFVPNETIFLAARRCCGKTDPLPDGLSCALVAVRLTVCFGTCCGPPAESRGGPPAESGGGPLAESGGGPPAESGGGPLAESGAGGVPGATGVGGNQDYDPHEHRDKSKATNNLETLMHLLKASVGTGVMAIPQAMGMAGLVTATVAMVLATAVLTHCLQVAVQSRYRACIRQRVPIMTYEEAMAEAVRAGPLCTRRFAATSSRVVTMFVNVFQLGTGCIYIVFMAETLRKLIDPSSSVLLYMAALMPPLMVLVLIPTLKRLAPVSALANLLLILGLCIVMFIVFSEEGEVKNQESLNVWGNAEDFPMFFGTALFALCSVGVVLQLENSMLYPKSFTSTCGVFQQSMVMVLVMYLVFGLSGYALYCGDKCQDSITLDLPEGVLPVTVNSLLVLAIFLSYVLHMFVPNETIFLAARRCCGKMEPPTGGMTCSEVAVRLTVCFGTFVAAAVVPKLGLFISLFGALCMSALGICFPMIMEVCLAHPYEAPGTRMLLFKDFVLFMLGMMALVTGTVAAFKEIIESFL